MSLVIRHPEALTQRPAAVFLDFDNTLFPYEPAHRSAMEATGQRASKLLGLELAAFERAHEESRRQVKMRLGETASAHSRLLYFSGALEILGLKGQPVLALDLEHTYWRTFLSASDLFPEARDFLDDLRLADIPTAMVTDLTSQIQFRKLIYFGLDKTFDYVVTSEEAGVEKPQPGPFRMALEKLGLPAEARVWFVGDDAKKDIAGARKALNAAVFQKLHRGVTLSEEADVVFESYRALRQTFSDLLRSGSWSGSLPPGEHAAGAFL
jgi:putative hydrolase of the HAD superfamily